FTLLPRNSPDLPPSPTRRSSDLGDSTMTAQRATDNDAILNFSLPPEQMGEVLQRVNCQYVVVAKGSPAVSQFRKHPELFAEAFADRKSTRLNSSHVSISYAVFCL